MKEIKWAVLGCGVIANEMASQQVWVNYIVFTDLYGHVYQLNNVNQGTYDFYNYYSDKDILEEKFTMISMRCLPIRRSMSFISRRRTTRILAL